MYSILAVIGSAWLGGSIGFAFLFPKLSKENFPERDRIIILCKLSLSGWFYSFVAAYAAWYFTQDLLYACIASAAGFQIVIPGGFVLAKWVELRVTEEAKRSSRPNTPIL
jgi:hypothetical protein